MKFRSGIALIAAGVMVVLASCGATGEVADVARPAETAAIEPTAIAPTAAPEPTAEVRSEPAPEPATEPETPLADLGEVPERRVRYCTTDVAFDEVLNVRTQPGLDERIIGRVPGFSCAITAEAAASPDADWLAVRFETGHVRHDGFVSTTFIEQSQSKRSSAVALEWVQAVLDGRDPSAWDYSPAFDGVEVVAITELRGGIAVPYVTVSGTACVFEGDVTLVCGVQVNDQRGNAIRQFEVVLQAPGANGYGPEYFPEDFGELPLVIGFANCGLHTGACDVTEWQTLAVDSDAGLLGVPIGSEPEFAIAKLMSILGAPTTDSGWVVGCPLDSETDTNERYVEWGALTAGFYRNADVPNGFWYWSYDFAAEPRDAEMEARFRLPGRTRGGATLTAVSEASRLLIETHELLGDPVINGPGWTLLGQQNGDIVDLTLAGVPYIPVCD